ncbi:PHD finger protein 24-like [Acanthaster planci]|uniref:PHD finger protein 24-like n=1 Tax=Acanthaster planci TaxID=133434 RepID=A0A8B7Y5D8_ACAPL|nr:PHD finger protein 24-like [Acanthaster planci]
MGTVVTKKKRFEVEEDLEVDVGEATKQAKRVGRLSMIISAMRPSARTDGAVQGHHASSAWSKAFSKRSRLGLLPPPTETLSEPPEEYNARLTREEELRALDFHDPEGKLKYDAELPQSETEDQCAICTMYKRDTTLLCRVCGQPYHHGCLIGRGLGLDTNSSRAMENAESDIGWSCPDCETLSELLPMDNMSELMIQFDSYDADGDSVINITDYMEHETINYQQKNNESLPSSKARECEEMFRTYDRDNDGSVSWWDYSMVETIKWLQRQPQNKLLEYLKPKEIAKLRSFFRMSDKRNVGLVTVGESEQAYRGWLRALGLHETEEMMHSFEKSSWSDECNKMITWERFISSKALALITSRPNTITIKPFVTTREETAL